MYRIDVTAALGRIRRLRGLPSRRTHDGHRTVASEIAVVHFVLR